MISLSYFQITISGSIYNFSRRLKKKKRSIEAVDTMISALQRFCYGIIETLRKRIHFSGSYKNHIIDIYIQRIDFVSMGQLVF